MVVSALCTVLLDALQVLLSHKRFQCVRFVVVQDCCRCAAGPGFVEERAIATSIR